MKTPYQYEKIREILLARISSGELMPGDRVPSERELARELDCSFHTVRHAMGILVDEGVIVRRVGTGSFVADNPPILGLKHTVGVLLNADGGAYAGNILQALQTEAEASGFELMIRSFSELKVGALVRIEHLADNGCSSIVIPWFSSGIEADHDMAKLIEASPLPITIAEPVAGCEDNCFEASHVFGSGDRVSVEIGCRYFQALGHERIAFLCPDRIDNHSVQRHIAAYARYVSENGLENLTVMVDQTARSIDRVVDNWGKTKRPIAVIAMDDTHALRLMTSLHKHGMSIPEDYAVLGFNNIPSGISSDPPLSSMQHSYRYIASNMLAHAVSAAQGRLVQTTGGAQHHFVVRESCGGSKLDRDGITAIMNSFDELDGYSIEPASFCAEKSA
ncbi:MAG: substrate-binding domain-containing protein [Planctomycetes bacterium]|nr:substrate-binding domain-containing protein [Planctomycetota bacterium]